MVAPARIRVGIPGQRDARGVQPLGDEAQLDVPDLARAAREQRGRDEQAEGERELEDDEQVHDAPDTHPRGPAGIVAERGGEIAVRRPQRGQQPGEEAAGQHHGEHEPEDPYVQPRRHPDRHALAEGAAQRLDAQRRDQHGEDAAEHGEQQRLDENLADDARAAGAERGDDGQVPAPVHRAHEQQVGNVHARHHQHQQDRAQHRDHGAAGILTGEARGERLHGDAHVGIALRVALRHAARYHIHLCCGLATADPVAQPPDHIEGRPGRIGHQGGIDDERQPQVAAIGETKRLRHDPDDAVRTPVHEHGPAQHRGIAPEAIAPHVVAEQHHRRRGIIGTDGAADLRAYSQHREQLGRRPGRTPAVRAAFRAQRRRAVPERGDRLEGTLLLPPGDPVAGGRTPALAARAVRPALEVDDALRLLEREAAQHHPVHHAEHGCGQANAQREGQHGEEGEARLAQQRPGCLAQLVDHGRAGLGVNGRERNVWGRDIGRARRKMARPRSGTGTTPHP